MAQLFSLSDIPQVRVADVDAALDRAFALADRGDPRLGKEAAEAALALARSAGDARRVARALSIVSHASRSLGEYARAATACEEAVALLAAFGPTPSRAAARIDAAIVHFDLGEYPKALAVLAAARDDLALAPDAVVQSRGDHFQGMLHSRLGEFALARASFERALAARREAADDGALATTLNSLGVVALREAQADGIDRAQAAPHFERTIALCSEARDLAERAGDARLAHLAEINLAGALGGLGRTREALQRFLALLDATRASGDRRNESLLLVNAAEAARLCGEAEQARTLAEQAVDVAARFGSKSAEQRARLELSLACEAAGDFAAALAQYRAYHVLERETQATQARATAQANALRAEVEAARDEAERLRRMSSDLERENRALVREAREDPLTGLLNRRALDEVLVNALAASRFGGRTLAIVVFDVDRFKSINDRFSHAVGDAVLQALAGTLRAHCRSSDAAARIGGEEFVLVLADTSRDNAISVAERVRREIAAHDWSAVAEGLAVSVSAGVVVDPGQGSVASLLRDADAALYRAKREGRDRVCADERH